MCIFLLQTLSVETNFGKSLNKRFDAQDTLPVSIRVTNFNGTYADFLIHVGSPLFGYSFCAPTDIFPVNIQYNHDKPRKIEGCIPRTAGGIK